MTTLVCPVSLGDIGNPTDDRIDPNRVALRWVHKPMLFSMQQAQVEQQHALASRVAAGQSGLNAARYQAEELQQGFFSIFRGDQIGQKQRAVVDAEQQIERDRRMQEQAERQAGRLAGEFVDLPIFIDGERVAMV